MLRLFAVVMALATAAADDAPGLLAQRLYNGVGHPVTITVRAGPSAGDLALVLMGADGTVLADAVKVDPGPADLATLLPDVWRIRRACYLQLLEAEKPVGSALVLDPMLSRLVPIPQIATNPDGITYSRIIAWHDELDPLPSPVRTPADEAATARQRDGGTLAAAADEGRLFSGLRIYPERDVVLHTSKGDIRLAMRPDHAPNTVRNFLQLCAEGFYRGVVFHRVVPYTRGGDPFVIQAGDPTGTGNGGPGYWLPIEPSGLPHDFGVISMARDVPPDSAGSQFFICLSREGTARLDGHYCAFGEAVAGAETIRAIAAVDLADVPTGRPVDPPVIEAAVLVPSPPRALGAGRPDQAVSQLKTPVEPPPVRVPR